MNMTFHSVSSHAVEILADEQGNLFAKQKVRNGPSIRLKEEENITTL